MKDNVKNVAKIQAHKGDAKSITFSENGFYMGSCGADNTVKVWDLRKIAKASCELQSYKLPDSEVMPEKVVFDHSGIYLACAGDHTRFDFCFCFLFFVFCFLFFVFCFLFFVFCFLFFVFCFLFFVFCFLFFLFFVFCFFLSLCFLLLFSYRLPTKLAHSPFLPSLQTESLLPSLSNLL